jgi:hypothetical protein
MGTPAESTLAWTWPLALGLRGGKPCDVGCVDGGGRVPPGDAKGSGGGLMAICDARLEPGVDVWRDSEPEAGCVPDALPVPAGRGDPGTVFRSGAIVLVWVRVSRWL